MDKLVLGARIIDLVSNSTLASFEGLNWFRDFKLVFTTYYKDNTTTKWEVQVLRKSTNKWITDRAILQNI